MTKRVTVTRESDTGRNTHFFDRKTGVNMDRRTFVSKIQNGSYSDYYVRNINGVLTPCSKPDGNTKNNLG